VRKWYVLGKFFTESQNTVFTITPTIRRIRPQIISVLLFIAQIVTLFDTILNNFFGQANAGDYVSLQAYVRPTEATIQALQSWRMALRDRYRLATTLGIGPRFLHSTGQLHKGDGGNGLFVQITCDDDKDVAIPDEAGSSTSSMSFGVLKAAQALGDRQALLDAKRRVIRFHLSTDVVKGIQTLKGSFG